MDHLTDGQIWSFLEGDLDELEIERIEMHMESCDVCCERLASLAELGEEVPNLFPLEQPSFGFADRVMAEIAAEERKVVPFPTKRRVSTRLESLTRFATAAVVTGFMVLGSTHVQGLPMIGSFGKAVSETGNVVSDGTMQVYETIDGWIAFMNKQIKK
ncbi:MAG: anti-sigma factor family protein [Tumebacillaceae bacterium]